MDSQNLSKEEQIAIIEHSLKHASAQKTGASNYYLIWGFILFTFFIIQYCHAVFKTVFTASVADYSMFLFAIGGILSFLQSRKDDNAENVVPLNEKVYKFGWIGASISLAALTIAYMNNFIEIYCAGILISFGLANFIIGGITKFRPLVIGGAVSMLLCSLITHVSLEYKFLLTAAGVASVCIIPGFLMKNTDAHV